MLSVALLEGPRENSQTEKKADRVHETPISKEPGGRLYNVVTRLYMAQGFDGYEAFKDCEFLVDKENGRIMSDLVRHFLLGKTRYYLMVITLMNVL